MARLDHVILAVSDLDAAAERLLAEHGFASVVGGRHEALGTANRIVPMGRSYLELIAVFDPELAARNPVGQRISREASPGGTLFGWCLATDAIDEVANRFGFPVVPGMRRRSNGDVVEWRAAGLLEAMGRPGFPFFLQWDTPAELHPGREQIPHPVGPRGFAWVEVAGPADALRPFVGDVDVEVRIVAGDPGLRAVGISTTSGDEIVIGSKPEPVMRVRGE